MKKSRNVQSHRNLTFRMTKPRFGKYCQGLFSSDIVNKLWNCQGTCAEIVNAKLNSLQCDYVRVMLLHLRCKLMDLVVVFGLVRD